MKRLWVAISHHGFGHLAQTAPVLEALHARRPDIELIVASALPQATLAARLAVPFEHLARPSDCNFVMHDSVNLDLPASLAAYRAFHDDWPGRVAAEARAMIEARVDAAFSNVGYLPLAAAQQLGLPSMAMCSLNWADLFWHYLHAMPGAAELHDAMQAAYAGAQAFLRPTPSMPMPALANGVAIDPVVQFGRPRRAALAQRLGIDPDSRIVLVGLGGIPHRLAVEAWPKTTGLTWLVPDAWQARGVSIQSFSQAGMTYVDLLASADALVTKPGYGSFAEAAAHGLPVLYVPRPDWPEAVYLVDWLHRHGRASAISPQQLEAGELAGALDRLWRTPAPPVPACTGAIQAAEQLLTCLS